MPGLLLPQTEPTPTSLKLGLRHTLSGITNEDNTISVPPPSPPRTTVVAAPPVPTQTIRDIQLVFDASPGAFVHIKKLGPDLIIARELDYHWCRGKSSARPMCFKICKKAERTRESVVNELLAYKNLVKKDFVGTAFILRLDGIFEDQERVFLAFNFVQRNLADVLVGPRSDIIQYKVQWVAQIVLGLSAIHTCGIIHRDLKPSNVLLDDHNNIRIAGFDAAFIKSTTGGRRNTDPAEHLSSSSPSPTLKCHSSSTSKKTAATPKTYPPGSLASDEVRGTWPYMAPEVLANALKRFKIDKRMYTKAVDYWSLGCLVYALETGKALFGNFGDITLYGRCKNDEKYHRFGGLDKDAESMIYGLTRSDVAKRFGDASLRKHAYFRDENGESEFKKWSKYRPPVPKTRPEAHIHIEPDDDVLPRNNPILYRPCLNYADSVPGGSLQEVKSPLSQNTPSRENSLSKSSRENRSASKVSDSTPRPSEGLVTSEDEWILGEHCWINPRGIWGTSAGRGMPDKNLILYETHP